MKKILPVLSAFFAVFSQYALAVDAPVLSPTQSDSIRILNVQISAPAASVIRYTTNGTDPTPGDPDIASGGTVVVGRNLTLKARAWDAQGNYSPVVAGDYRITGMVGAGTKSAFAVKSNGKLSAWGAQASGQLGNGLTATLDVPNPVGCLKGPAPGTAFSDAVFVAGGELHTLAIDEAGYAWAFGINTYGQLGQNNTTTPSAYAQKVLKSATAGDFLSNVRGVDGGISFSVAVDGAGNAWSWGLQTDGRLGNGNTTGNQLYAQAVTTQDAGNPALTGIAQVAAGGRFAVARGTNGQVWSWGYNTSGQLGDGTSSAKNRAGKVKLNGNTPEEYLGDVVDISAGFEHVVALRNSATEEGTVWCWGLQTYGRLGNGVVSAADVVYPVQVQKVGGGNLDKIVQVAAGSQHSLALDENGNVWSWGDNGYGQLGDGGTSNRGLADRVKLADGSYLDHVVYIAAGGTYDATYGYGFSLALCEDGTLYTFGYNADGQLGNGGVTTTKYATASNVVGVGNLPPATALTATPDSVMGPTNVQLQATASDGDGNIAKVDFYNGDQLLSSVSSAPYQYTWQNVAAGTYTVKTVAYDNYGASTVSQTTVEISNPLVGVGSVDAAISENSPTPGKFRISVLNGSLSAPLTVNVATSGTAAAGEDFTALPASVVIPVAGFVDVNVQPAADAVEEGDETVVLTVVAGSNYKVGESAAAVMVIQNEAVVQKPVFQPDAADSVREVSVQVSCPTPGVTIHYTTDGQDPTGNDPEVTNGGTIVLGRNLTLKARAWDSQGHASAIATETYRITGMVGAGTKSAFAVKSNGKLSAWGAQASGQLGNGLTATLDVPNPVGCLKGPAPGTAFSDAVFVAGGELHTLAIDEAGYAWAFGINTYGQLGQNNTTTPSAYAQKVLKSATAGDFLSNVRGVDGGISFSVAVDGAGNAWSWGLQTDGRLGNGNTTGNQLYAQAVTTQDAGNPALTGIAQVAAGGRFAVARGTNGQVWSWGYNTSGQLGDGTSSAKNRAGKVKLNGNTPEEYLGDVVDISAGFEHVVALRNSATEEGTVWCWGLQTYGRLGNGVVSAADVVYPVQVQKVGGGNLDKIVQVAAGSQHSLALDENGNVWSWGDNGYGQLGDGGTSNRGLADRVKLADGSYLDHVVYIAAGGTYDATYGYGFSLALCEDGTLYTFGYNADGQLGNGGVTTTKYATASNVVGQANQAPSVSLGAGGPYTQVPADVTLTAAASDPDGAVSRVDFYNGSTLLGTATTAPWTFNWSGVPAGNYSVSAVAYDNYGSSATATQTLVVNVPEEDPLTKRYSLGSGENQNYRSFVIPLDFQEGKALEPMGDNHALYPNTTPWFLQMARPVRRHLVVDGTTASYPLQFQNPIAAFGSEAGGSPMYVGRSYRFGVSSGSLFNYSINLGGGAVGNYQIFITALRKSDMGVASQSVINVPRPNPQSSQEQQAWQNFVNAGYRASFIDGTTGLTTEIQRVEFPEAFGVTNQVDANGTVIDRRSGLILKHRAANDDYYFVVESLGLCQGTPQCWMALNDSQTAPERVTLYTMSFDDVPPWRADVLIRPQFFGEPMPSHYAGKSVPELLNKRTTDIAATLGDPSGYLALDTSEELRIHPNLDAVVENLSGGLSASQKALSIANYVINEIRLTDALGYPEAATATSAPDMTEEAIFAPGMKRNAYSTYLEGQGSPWEQAALLVYMLRKSGIPAAYVIPERNAMKMLDVRLSSVLGFQIRGVMDSSGNVQGITPGNQPTLIPVNWPWVAAYVDNKWVHIFPWMKDVEIIEGYNPYEFMPAGFDNGPSWLRKYIMGDSSILSLKKDDDTPRTLFVEYLKKQLATNHPDISFDDIGMQVRYRKINYASFNEMPTPFEVEGTATGVALLNSVSGLFDTVKVVAKSVQTPTRNITTSDMPLMDILDRRLLVKFTRTTASNLYLNLVMEPFRPGITSTGDFVSETFATLARKQTKSVGLTVANDLTYNVSVTFNMNRRFWQAFHQYNGVSSASRWENYLGLSEPESTTFDSPMRQGDMGAIVIDLGRVTGRKIEPHYRELQAVQDAVRLNPSSASSQDEDVYLGGVAQMVGLNYFHRLSESREELARLHKAISNHWLGAGLGMLVAKRTANGTLPNGSISLVQPYVDMPFHQLGAIGNDTARLDSGAPSELLNENNFLVLTFAELSAQEHFSLNQFFGDSDSISTIKLLHIAGAAAIKEATASNYTQFESLFTGANPSEADFWNTRIKPLFVQSDGTPNPMAPWTKVYLTPGHVTGANGDYKGVGALIYSPLSAAALIGPNRSTSSGLIQNGGAGRTQYNHFNSNYGAVSSFSLPDYSVSLTSSNYVKFSLSGSPGSSSSYTPSTSWSFSNSGLGGFVNYATSTPYNLNSTQSWFGQTSSSVLGLSLSSSNWSSSATFSSVLQATVNRGMTGGSSWASSGIHFVGDPVNVITGAFYVDHTDLTLPGPIPLELRRNYDSQSTALTSLGYGWKPSIVPYLVVTEDTNKIYAADEDGSVVAYVRVGATDEWRPTTEANPGLCNLRNEEEIGGPNNPFNAQIVRSVESADIYYRLTTADGSVRTFREREFPLTYPASGNSTALTLDRRRPYLEKWEDNRGNSLSFTFGETAGTPEYGEMTRVVASNGNFLGFVYDSYRHMVEAYSGDGRHVYYSFDDQGDLRKVTLADGSTIGYDYKLTQSTESGKTVWTSTHLIEKELKPEGRILVNTYDIAPNDRRIKEQQAVVGGNAVPVTNAKFVYTNTKNADGSYTGATEVEDGLANKMRYEYTTSLITAIKDQLNQAVTREWYPDSEASQTGYKRSIKKLVDKRGLITEFQYDIRGNVTQKKVTGDLTGDGVSDTATTTITYNDRGLPVEVTTPTEMAGSARKREFVYGDAGQPWLATAIRDYAGSTLLSETRNTYENIAGGTTSAYGLLKETKTAAGTPDESTTQFTNNSQGFATSEKRLTGTEDPAVVRTLDYNLRGELVRETDALGRSKGYAYDGLGNRIWTEIQDETGKLVSWEYRYFNKNGEIEWVDGPRYYPEDYVYTTYDGGGRPKEKLVWRSQANADGSGVTEIAGLDDFVATIKFTHDKYGNMTEVLDPRRNTTTMTYDKVGQMLSRAVHTGGSSGPVVSSESWTYEPGGEVATATNPLGGVTTVLYTATGKPRYRQNPDGTILGWRYDLLGRPVKEILPNGSFRDIAYDDAARTVTRTLRNAGGTTLAEESEVHDRRGNMVSATDAGGNTFTAWFDALDRVKAKWGPAGLSTASTYDAAGKVTVVKNALNESVVTTTDAEGRTISTETKDIHGSVIRRTAYEYSADHHAVTKIEGAALAPYRTTTWTDPSGAVLAVRHPDGGTSVTIRDAVGNAVESRDELGNITKWEYDAANRLAKTTLPGGAEIGLTLDAAGNVLERSMPGNTREIRTYDTASRPLTSKLQGTGDTRQMTYGYFTAGTNVGLLQTATDALGVVKTYGYDDFQRNVSVTVAGSQPAHNMLLSKEYDPRGLLTAVEQTYTGGSPFGPAVRVERDFDAYGDIFKERVKVAGILVSEFAQGFDAARRRTSLDFLPAAQGNGTGRSRNFTHRPDGLLSGTSTGSTAFAFTYGLEGLLTSRTGAGLTMGITQRDENGRPATRQTTFGGNTVYTESLSWQPDGKLATYSGVRAGSSTQGISSEYIYNGRGQLLNEWSEYSDANTLNWTYGFDPDYGFAGTGLGVRLAAKRQTTNSGPDEWEQGSWYIWNTDEYGRGTMEGKMSPANNLNLWNSDYDAMGNQTHRGVVDAGYKDQTLTWDGFGRLVKLAQRDGANTGFDFTALYDGLGRRIRTTEQVVTAGVAGGSPRIIESYHDPEVEFLEVGLSVDGNRIWKLYGGDFESGAYGASQGMGGLLATVEESNSTVTPFISDHFGHVQGRISGGVTQWSGAQYNSYGEEATGTIPALTSASLLPQTLGWRGQRVDVTGLINMGMRPYDPESGRFLSADPLGHEASLSLYDYASGDPINNLDPDGRFGKGISSGWSGSVSSSSPNSGAFHAGLMLGGMFSGGAQGFQGGASITANTLSFGGSDYAGWTNSGQYQGSEYTFSRISSTIARESLITAATLGTAQLARGGSQAAYYSWQGLEVVNAGRSGYSVGTGAVQISNGDYVGGGLNVLGGGLGLTGSFYSALNAPVMAPRGTPWTQVSSDARAILRDVEARTGMTVPGNQRSLLADQVRAVDHRVPVSDAQYRALQAEYRASRGSMISQWEANTGQVWPSGAQAHHVIPTRYGGPNQWWNIHPAQGGAVHQGGIHGVGSPTQTVFPTPIR